MDADFSLRYPEGCADLDGLMTRQSRLVRGRRCVSREARCTASIIWVARMSNSSPSYLRRSWVQRFSEKLQK